MRDRYPFAYVVSIDGSSVTLNLKDEHRGSVSSHRDGIATVTDIGALFAVESGSRLLIHRVRSLSFSEPREAHRSRLSSTVRDAEPLRYVIAATVGVLERRDGQLRFIADTHLAPPLGAEAFPLTLDEVRTVFDSGSNTDEWDVVLGDTVRGFGPVRVGIQNLLPRHVAVLGGTGHGKSCFTAAVLQQLSKMANPRIVIFDVNGEYAEALVPHISAEHLKQTTLGGPSGRTIPYYALGRHGLSRLLLPSEKTQRPALSFALEQLPFVSWSEDGAALSDEDDAVFFDDCRTGDATDAHAAIGRLRSSSVPPAEEWPPMEALGCLVAESHALKPGRNGAIERDTFAYSNIAPLVTRIKRCLDDPMFASVVSTRGGPSTENPLNWHSESKRLVSDIFGDDETRWKIHVVDLRNVAHDLMPLILGSLLELFAFELFERGQGETYPTLLVLEEAHHYLRQFTEHEEYGRQSLAYERLAKEGRKFGLSLWLSTQRPSEVSPTVLAQCGTWVAFRLSGDADMRALASAAEWIDRNELSAVAGLPRQHALIFGASVPMPVRIRACTANPLPRSEDPQFGRWRSNSALAAEPKLVLPKKGTRSKGDRR